MTWRPIDCHAHTTFSDGTLTPAELIALAQERGVRPGIADHVTRDIAYGVRSVAEARAYLDELERHDVARGAEFCWHDALWRELPDDVLARFTHCLGSLHAVIAPGISVPLHAFRPLPSGLDPQTYMDIHLENLERLAREMPVDILAHPTLVPLAFRGIAPEELWTEAREERAVQALARAGIAFELSARYPPHPSLVARAAAAGVRFSLGSDGHTADQVADLTSPRGLARMAGVRDEDLYDPYVHGRRAA